MKRLDPPLFYGFWKVFFRSPSSSQDVKGNLVRTALFCIFMLHTFRSWLKHLSTDCNDNLFKALMRPDEGNIFFHRSNYSFVTAVRWNLYMSGWDGWVMHRSYVKGSLMSVHNTFWWKQENCFMFLMFLLKWKFWDTDEIKLLLIMVKCVVQLILKQWYLTFKACLWQI